MSRASTPTTPAVPRGVSAAALQARIRAALVAQPEHRGGVLLAVSGGADSVLLLIACAPLLREGLALEVAWIDHGVRPEAGKEGAHVARLAAEHGLDFHARALKLEAGAGFEARARVAREAALEEVRAARGLALIATGHTASDQAETLLMRLSRGAALRGAAGILERKGRLVRPMLAITRAEVRSTLRTLGASWCEDAMNLDPGFLRVRVRTEVLPALETAVGSDVAPRLARFASLAAEDDAYLEEEATRALARLSLHLSGETPCGRRADATVHAPAGLHAVDPSRIAGLDAVGLRALVAPLRRRALQQWIRARVGPLGGERLVAALSALEAGGSCELRKGVSLACEGGRVRLLEAAALEAPPDTIRLSLAEAQRGMAWDGGRWRLGLSLGPVPPAHPHRHPLSSLPEALELRVRRRGDRVRRADGHHHLVAELMVDAKLPREARARWPLVALPDGPVLWVPGAQRAPAVDGVVAWLWAEAPGEASARHGRRL